jgi:membrane-associated phospholipid phosphatase
MFRTRLGLTLLLVVVFAVNLAETTAEGRIGEGHSLDPKAYRFAQAMQKLEGYVGLEKFENHDATNNLAVWGYSISYFLVFPLLCLGIAFALLLREDIAAYRVLCSATAIDYLISLVFFVFVPVPERWFVPDSGAMLLSDLANPKLIEWIRPISSLDNCFPSTHTSLMVILILCCYLFRVRLRTTVLALGIMVLFATFALGIHWLPDILAGIAVGWLSVVLAQRFAT